MNRISQSSKDSRQESSDVTDGFEKNNELGELSEAEKETSPSAVPRKSSWLKKLFYISLVGTILLALVVWYCVAEAQKVPEFYANVLQHDKEISKAEGDKFERNLAMLNNAFRLRTPWKLNFTQDEVNGWLASDLDEKFGDLVPTEFKEPRIVFNEHDVRIAFKYEKNGVNAVVVAKCDVFCTEKENEFAIKLLEVRSGVLSLPIGPWLERITEGFQFAGIDVTWADEDDKPVALIQMPDQLSSSGLHQYVILEAIDIRPGQLVIAGSSARKQTKPKNAETPATPKPNQQPASPVK